MVKQVNTRAGYFMFLPFLRKYAKIVKSSISCIILVFTVFPTGYFTCCYIFGDREWLPRTPAVLKQRFWCNCEPQLCWCYSLFLLFKRIFRLAL